jgi:2-methylisocitrate lyase-like PEP mutase family enzyme
VIIALAARLRLPAIYPYRTFSSSGGLVAQAISKPLIADADTGYGGLLNVYHTVRGYEKAGVAMIQLEDQQIPKKCGHTPNRHIPRIVLTSA